MGGTTIILYEKPKHPKPPQGDFKHGYVEEGSIDLTIEEAKLLVIDLSTAIDQANRLEKGVPKL